MDVWKIVTIAVIVIMVIFLGYQAYTNNFISPELVIIVLLLLVILFVGYKSMAVIEHTTEKKDSHITPEQARHEIMKFLKRDKDNEMQIDYEQLNKYHESSLTVNENGRIVTYFGIIARLKPVGNQYNGDDIKIIWNLNKNEIKEFGSLKSTDDHRNPFANFKSYVIAGGYQHGINDWRRDMLGRGGNVIVGAPDTLFSDPKNADAAKDGEES